jgi:subtilisin family serine protease
VSGIAGVDGVDVDDVVQLDDPTPGPNGQVSPDPYPEPSAGTPVVNPYMPIGDTGAAQFVQAHQAWDGRGTTIAIVDSGVDLAHPALQITTTGERKVVDWVTMTDPTFTGTTNNDADPTWIQMGTQVSGPTFSAAGATWTAPAGAYRFGVFNERDPRLGGELGNDINCDGNPAGSSGTFGVLWDTASNTVRVDANQNRSFADDAAMTDYKVNKDVPYFGTDNPATPIVERMPFVVQTDGKNKVVNIGIVSGGPRLARRGHHGGERTVRRGRDRRRTGRQDRRDPRLPLHRGLHKPRPARGHDLRGQDGQRRRHQHVDRRAAGSQRRQQRPGPALRQAHHAEQRPDVHLRGQQRRRAQHDRRPVGGL